MSIAPNATHFWIEAGAMSGVPIRFQIEFPDELAQFFDQASRTANRLQVDVPGHGQHDCDFVFRGSDYGQWSGDIWRLSLPQGPAYAGNVLHFHRVGTAQPFVYHLVIASPGSAQVLEWNQHSVTTGRTGLASQPNGREFGSW